MRGKLKITMRFFVPLMVPFSFIIKIYSLPHTNNSFLFLPQVVAPTPSPSGRALETQVLALGQVLQGLATPPLGWSLSLETRQQTLAAPALREGCNRAILPAPSALHSTQSLLVGNNILLSYDLYFFVYMQVTLRRSCCCVDFLQGHFIVTRKQVHFSGDVFQSSCYFLCWYIFPPIHYFGKEK